MPRPRRKPRTKEIIPRALIRNSHLQNRPPGLKGKEIGLYYRDLHKRFNSAKPKERLIYLRISQTLIDGIYRCLDKIESIANKNNIYLPPTKKLIFSPPIKNSDFIPIKVPDSERLLHAFSNIYKKDNDVIMIKTKEPEPIVISDSEENVISESDFAEASTSAQASSSTLVVNESDVFVSNIYNSKEEYKYGYDDIISATFQEKLAECLSNGIEISNKTEMTEAMNTALKQDLEDMLNKNDKYKQMLKFRKTLPTFKKAKELLDVINKNQVIVISGETGCGKSTQVPQLILDEAIANYKGANVKVLVTEPRRIAASTLAARVAEERGERLGRSVGYSVRLEGVQSRERGSIMYCTTGVLLVNLEKNQALSGYSHIILDEVHERDCQVDIALCMLKQVLEKRKDLKLILMSATIDADALSKYFDNCPLVQIEGLAYPVKDIYLEEILDLTKFRLPKMENIQKPPKWHKYAGKGNPGAVEMEKEIQYRASMDPWLQSVKNKLDPDIFKLVQDYRIEELNLDLVRVLLQYICRGTPGAILVFLPGISEISKLITLMRDCRAFPEATYAVYALHSKLASVDQHKIFRKPPDHVRKIILATNIAETSITIDDVVYVIDCGKMKYKGLDVEENLSTLQVEWISKANLRQRRGRAGRCQPGVCYHLVTTHRASILPDRLTPELQRSNLLEEVLCIKKLRLGKAEAALKMMPAVPAEKTIHSAITHLQHLGALDKDEILTPLGWHLARLPVHPAAGKLLLLGALFGCLDRAASVAAVWGFKDPFQLVIGKEKEVGQAKREFALGEPSDHVALSEAIIQWEECKEHKRRSFAYDKFLSANTVKLLSDMKKQFAENLKEMGFLWKADVKATWVNRNTQNLSLFKAVVAASLYPNIASVKWVHPSKNRPLRIKAFTPEDGRVAMHPSSVLHNKRGSLEPIALNAGANWLVYWLKQKSTELFLLEVTCVYTLPLLFFGDIHFSRADNPDECLISISSMKVCCRKETAQLLYQLRSLLDLVLTSKISDTNEHATNRFDFDEEVLGAVINLITAEDEGAEYMDDEEDCRYYNYSKVSRESDSD